MNTQIIMWWKLASTLKTWSLEFTVVGKMNKIVKPVMLSCILWAELTH